MAASDIELLRHAWEAFARGDLNAATDVLDPHVRWYGAGDPDAEGACRNRDDALAFIQRALADGVTAEPLDFRDAGDRNERLDLLFSADDLTVAVELKYPVKAALAR